MWFLGMLGTMLGITLVVLAVASGHLHVDSRARWFLTRGAAVIALGVALLYAAAHGNAHLLPSQALQPLGFSSMLVEILAATTIALFGNTQTRSPLRPRSRPIKARRSTRLAGSP